MREFKTIVMSSTEPIKEGTLWIRMKDNTVSAVPGKPDKAGMSVWYFSEFGWKPLVDLDTRYNLTYVSDTVPSDKPIDSDIETVPENGIVNITNTFHTYDGDRSIGSNSNFVVESGLKKHVDELLNKISAIESRVEQAIENIRQNTASIATLTSRVSALESAEN